MLKEALQYYRQLQPEATACYFTKEVVIGKVFWEINKL